MPLAAAAALLALVQLGGLFSTAPDGNVRPRDLESKDAPAVVIAPADVPELPQPSGTLRRLPPGNNDFRQPYRRPTTQIAPGESDISLADFK